MLTAALRYERLDRLSAILSRTDINLDAIRTGTGTGSGLNLLESIAYHDHPAYFMNALLSLEPVQEIIRLHNREQDPEHIPLSVACFEGHYETVQLFLEHGVKPLTGSDRNILWFLCYRLGQADTNSQIFSQVLAAANAALNSNAEVNVTGTMDTYPIDGLFQNPVHFDHWRPIHKEHFVQQLDFIRRICKATHPRNRIGAFRRLLLQLEVLLTHKYDSMDHVRGLRLLPLRLWTLKVHIFLDTPGTYPDAVTPRTRHNPFQILVNCLYKAHHWLGDIYCAEEHKVYSSGMDLVHDVYRRLAPHAYAQTRHTSVVRDAVLLEPLSVTRSMLYDLVLYDPDMYTCFIDTHMEHLHPYDHIICVLELETKIQRRTAVKVNTSSAAKHTDISSLLHRLRSPKPLLVLAKKCIARVLTNQTTQAGDLVKHLPIPSRLQDYLAGPTWARSKQETFESVSLD